MKDVKDDPIIPKWWMVCYNLKTYQTLFVGI